MQHQLIWNNKEEGNLVFLEGEIKYFSFDIFVLEEEAELTINYIIEIDKAEVIPKLEYCLCKAFELLWKTGLEEVVFVDNNNTKVTELLKKIQCIEPVYSEYMMKRIFSKETLEQEKMKDTLLQITVEEDNHSCKDATGNFFCRLLPYEEGFYLYEVEVKKKMRNKGIATRCLKQLFYQLVNQKSEVTIYLQVGSYNEPALHLYQKLGFELSEEICYYTLKEELLEER